MSDFMLILGAVTIIILCAGSPDLLDALTQYVMSLSKVCPPLP